MKEKKKNCKRVEECSPHTSYQRKDSPDNNSLRKKYNPIQKEK